MNQRKIGEFLKQLRKEKNMTQEQLAEHFFISSRTVSRWETGSNMPDLDMLIDLAEFYNVDIYEIIDGERKSEKVENKTKLTLKKVVEYAAKAKDIRHSLCSLVVTGALLLSIPCMALFGEESKGLLYGIVPENICRIIMWSAMGLQLIVLIVCALESSGVIDKVIERNKKRKEKKEMH